MMTPDVLPQRGSTHADQMRLLAKARRMRADALKHLLRRAFMGAAPSRGAAPAMRFGAVRAL